MLSEQISLGLYSVSKDVTFASLLRIWVWGGLMDDGSGSTTFRLERPSILGTEPEEGEMYFHAMDLY